MYFACLLCIVILIPIRTHYCHGYYSVNFYVVHVTLCV